VQDRAAMTARVWMQGRWVKLLFIGGNPSTRSGRGDELSSIFNLKQTRQIATDLERGWTQVDEHRVGMNSVSTCARADDWAAQWAVRREKEGAGYWAASAKGGVGWAAHHGGHWALREWRKGEGNRSGWPG
jgi:hypothetical protein